MAAITLARKGSRVATVAPIVGLVVIVGLALRFYTIGVKLGIERLSAGPTSERACCSPGAVVRARETCHALGLPHVTLDLREAFRASVVDPFVEGYAAGITPNPCMRCNGRFRFDRLVDFAHRAGADVLWTGHYARIVERGGRRLVARAADPAKDQSYMLATVDPGLLEHVAFPLGGSTKTEVRAEAAAAGLAVAGRAESQEACFLAGGDYRSFLERRGVKSLPGEIVDGSVRSRRNATSGSNRWCCTSATSTSMSSFASPRR